MNAESIHLGRALVYEDRNWDIPVIFEYILHKLEVDRVLLRSRLEAIDCAILELLGVVHFWTHSIILRKGGDMLPIGLQSLLWHPTEKMGKVAHQPQ